MILRIRICLHSHLTTHSGGGGGNGDNDKQQQQQQIIGSSSRLEHEASDAHNGRQPQTAGDIDQAKSEATRPAQTRTTRRRRWRRGDSGEESEEQAHMKQRTSRTASQPASEGGNFKLSRGWHVPLSKQTTETTHARTHPYTELISTCLPCALCRAEPSREAVDSLVGATWLALAGLRTSGREFRQPDT